MLDIVERLRAEGRDAMSKHLSMGMWQLCADAANEIESLRSKVRHAGVEDICKECWFHKDRETPHSSACSNVNVHHPRPAIACGTCGRERHRCEPCRQFHVSQIYGPLPSTRVIAPR